MSVETFDKPFIDDPDQWIRYARSVTRRYVGQSDELRHQRDLFEDAVQEGLLMLISGGLRKADRLRGEKELRAYLSTWIFNGIQAARRQEITPLSGCRRRYAAGESRTKSKTLRMRVARAFGGRILDSEPDEVGGAASTLLEQGKGVSSTSVDESVALNDDFALAESYLCILSKRDQQILRRRFLDGALMKDVAEEAGVSTQRVQQIQLEAIRKIRAAIARRERMTGVAS